MFFLVWHPNWSILISTAKHPTAFSCTGCVEFRQVLSTSTPQPALDAGHCVRIVIDEDDLKKNTKIQGEGPMWWKTKKGGSWAQAVCPFDPFDLLKRHKKTSSWLPGVSVICEIEIERERERDGKKEKGHSVGKISIFWLSFGSTPAE